jgi:hypothetical protein
LVFTLSWLKARGRQKQGYLGLTFVAFCKSKILAVNVLGIILNLLKLDRAYNAQVKLITLRSSFFV